MRFTVNKDSVALIVILACVIQCEFAASYKSEVGITPAPIEEQSTKKSGGFFSGIKNFFRSSDTTTAEPPAVLQVTTPKYVAGPQSTSSVPAVAPTAHAPNVAPNRPPPLNINSAPLMPLGPRPDTPPTSPLSGNQHHPPMWPQIPHASTTTVHPPQQGSAGVPAGSTAFGSGAQKPNIHQPNLPPGITQFHPRPQPSGVDLSYGGAAAGGRPQFGGNSGAGLAPLTSTTTTSTTTPRYPQHDPNLDVRGGSQHGKEDFPALPTPRRPSGGVKEDFPALPTPRSPISTPSTPVRPNSPSVWNTPTPASPLNPNAPVFHPAAGSPTPPSQTHPSSTVLPHSRPTTSGHGISFVPHTGSSTTVRPGVRSSGSTLATDDEIRTLTESLYTKEVNSQLNLIQVHPQGKTRSIDSGDEAPQPLLVVDPKALEPNTIEKMRALFNNYEVDTLANEHVTPNEHREENEFLDAIMATGVMRQAMLFLQNKGIVSPDPKTHRDLVKELWFTQYSRGSGKIGSSGFEHVFVYEVKNGTLIGLHNWVYFHEEEAAGRLDYKGYMNQLDLGTKGKVLKARFTHNGLNKPVNTLFVGTSPELELALYTVCFQLRPDRTCPVSLGNSKFGIVTYSWRYRGKSLIGSAYPEI